MTELIFRTLTIRSAYATSLCTEVCCLKRAKFLYINKIGMQSYFTTALYSLVNLSNEGANKTFFFLFALFYKSFLSLWSYSSDGTSILYPYIYVYMCACVKKKYKKRNGQHLSIIWKGGWWSKASSRVFITPDMERDPS